MRQAKALLVVCAEVFLLAFIGLGALPREGSCQAGEATIGFVSDPTWQVSSMTPDGGIGVTLGPAQRVCACPYTCPPGATNFGHPACWGATLSAVPGATWIWQPGVSSETAPADLQGAYFTKEFDLPCPQASGRILIAADDFAEVRVNGVAVDSTGSVTDYGLAASGQSALKEFDLTPFLVEGKNTITIRAQNGPSSFGGGCAPCSYAGNPAGVVFGGSLSYSGATPAMSKTWGCIKALYR